MIQKLHDFETWFIAQKVDLSIGYNHTKVTSHTSKAKVLGLARKFHIG